MGLADGAAQGPLQGLAESVTAAAAAVRGGAGPLTAQIRLERPKHAGLGDYSTNAAMLLAPALQLAPRVIAERIGSELEQLLNGDLERWEVAGPGFLNLVLSDAWHRRALAGMLAAGNSFGGGGAGEASERILIEFVSANPTGPLVAASGRHAAYGDALARILEFHGHSVAREYYFNDAGGQIRLLGESVRARAMGQPVPEGGYQGEYVADLAASIDGAAERSGEELAGVAVERLLLQIEATLERYRVHYDSFFSERTLHLGSPSALERVLTALEASDHVYRSEGAVWLRTTTFGDDKDRVVVRSSGEPTYLAGDLAYLQNKRERGFDRQLMPVGSDHHAYARTLKAAMAALGGDPDQVEVPILQFVHLVEAGQTFAMSKRRGDFVTLDDLLDEIGVDATRFFMLRSSHDRTLELDVELARRQSRENPVYYVQYAHARIASMLRRLQPERVADALGRGAGWVAAGGAFGGAHPGGGELGSGEPGGAKPERGAAGGRDGSIELHEAERELIKKLASFPAEVVEAAARRAPHRIAGYALELAQQFTTFYENCHVIGATPEPVESFRIALSVAAQRVIAVALGLLGVSAPDAM
ncbi:MAG: arginine--tRNA ligase [Solirubrobacterales bacterium]|nr:arginine--tRNA ligase [Solirubrobacterales bacterium]